MALDTQEQRYQPYRYASDKPLEVDPAAPTPTQTLKQRTPCSDPKGKDESDLCAQWRAAYAAEDSALWTKWGFWVTVAGIAGLLVTINQTRVALDVARQANEITQKNLRLYQQAESALLAGGVEFVSDGGIVVTFKNLGRLPAHVLHFDFCVAPPDLQVVPITLSKHKHRYGVTVGADSRYESDVMYLDGLPAKVVLIGGIIFKDNVLGWQVSSLTVELDRQAKTYRVAHGYDYRLWLEKADELNRERERQL